MPTDLLAERSAPVITRDLLNESPAAPRPVQRPSQPPVASKPRDLLADTPVNPQQAPPRDLLADTAPPPTSPPGYVPIPGVIQQREEPSLLTDMSRKTAQGAFSLAGASSELLDAQKLSLDQANQGLPTQWQKFSLPVQSAKERAQEYKGEAKGVEQTLSTTQRQADQKNFLQKVNEDGSDFNPLNFRFDEGMTDPRKIAGAISQSVPAIATGLGLGRLLMGTGTAAGLSPAVAGALGFSTGEGLVAGTLAGSDVADRVRALSLETLNESPEYQKLVTQGIAPKDAREKMAQSAATEARWTAGGAAALLGLVPGALFGKAIKGEKIAGTRLGGAAKTALAEGVTEGAQGGSEALLSNLALQDANPNQRLGENFFESAVGEAIAGAPFGAGIGALAAPGNQTHASAPKDLLADTIPEISSNAPRDLLAETSIERAANETNTAPSEKQKESGNDKKGDTKKPAPQSKPLVTEEYLRNNALLQSSIQVDTPKFKQWFGKSQMLDDNGTPKVLYHGTTADFNEFKKTTPDIGFHVGTPEQAEDFVVNRVRLPKKDGRIMPVYIQLENPLRVNDFFGADFLLKKALINEVKKNIPSLSNSDKGKLDDMMNRLDRADDDYLTGENDPLLLEADTLIESVVTAAGHDGFVYKNMTEGFKGPDSYAVLKPNQIKSAVGNSGHFNADSDHILESRTNRTSTNPQNTVPELRNELHQSLGRRVVNRLEQNGVLTIVDSLTDPAIPQSARERMDISAENQTQGFYDAALQRTFLVARNIEPGAAAGVALHEIGVHYGLRRMLGDQAYDGILNEVNEGSDDARLVNAFESLPSGTYQYHYDSAINQGAQPDVADRYARNVVKEEALSYFVEQNTEAPLTQRILAAIKRFLQRQLGIQVNYTNDQLIALAVASLRRASRQPPVQQNALATARSKIGHPNPSMIDTVNNAIAGGYSGIRDMVREAGDRGIQGGLDRFYGIRRAESQLNDPLPAEQSGYVAARLSTGSSSVLQGALTRGIPEWRDGIIQRRENSRGLLQVFEPVQQELDDFLHWMIGNRAARLRTEGRENLFNENEIAALQGLGRGREQRFRQVAREFDQFKKGILDLAQNAGLIDATTRPLWDRADYIPFYRINEDTRNPRATGSGRELANQQSGIQELRGGTANLGNPLENILTNFSHLIDASMKNHAARTVMENLNGTGLLEDIAVTERFRPRLIAMEQIRGRLQEHGVDARALPAEALQGLQRVWSFEAPTDPDVIRIMENGRARYVRIRDPLLLRSLTAITGRRDSALEPVIRPMRFMKRLLTQAVTADPGFMLRNAMRDALSSWVITQDRWRPMSDSVRGAINQLREQGGFEPLQFAGGSFDGGYVNANEPREMEAAIRRTLRIRGFNESQMQSHLRSVVYTPLRWWDRYQRIGAAFENASRDAVYQAAVNSGKPTAQAVFEAKDLMDFSMQGDWALMQIAGDVLPFFNARLQGLNKLARSGALPIPGMIDRRNLTKGMIIAMFSTLLYLKNRDDERYDELEEWDKNTYWHLFFGDWVPEALQHVRIPKPFEVGALYGTIPERIAANFSGTDDGEKTLKQLGWILKETFALDPVPQGVRPAVETFFNYNSFTGRTIEGMADKQRQATERFSGSTSPTAVETARALGMSPKKLEHLFEGYFGTMGSYILSLSDVATRAVTDAPPLPKSRVDEIPIVKSFIRGAGPAKSTRFSTEFYEMLREANELFGSANFLEQNGRQPDLEKLLSDPRNMALLGARKPMNTLQRNLNNMRKQSDAIYRSRKMTPDQKRERLDKLLTHRNKLLERAVLTIQRRLEPAPAQ